MYIKKVKTKIINFNFDKQFLELSKYITEFKLAESPTIEKYIKYTN